MPVLRRRRSVLHMFRARLLAGRMSDPFNHALPWLLFAVPWLMVLALVWALLVGQNTAHQEAINKVNAQATQITILTFRVPTPTPEPLRRYPYPYPYGYP